ncbi:MAG TPA: acyltransferase domain-containing protein [Actinomycetes bacterium]|nr:acyltransferase domain-containing protein [Actinomycetes bacterium]
MLVIVAPGQGAQSPGFLTPWLELPGFEDRLRWLSACAGMDLIHYGTNADAETIRDTAVAQPLLVGAGLVALLSLFPHPTDAYKLVGIGAGHSVGEITAAAAAGVLSAEQAMVLVRERGKAMAQAAAMEETGMTAVLGGEQATVLASIDKHSLTAANNNGSGQIVAAGSLTQLAAFQDDPPEGAKLRPLSVAGAFHTHYMQPAVTVLAEYARAVSTHDARTRLLSNADGVVVQSGREYLKRLVLQVSNPVRWDLCMHTMGELGVTALIEIPPAGTLAGLAKRALPGVEIVALKTPDDLEAARDLVERHGSPSPMSATPSWRMLVAPAKGTFHQDTVSVGDNLEPAAVVGRVVTNRDEQVVVAPHGGTIVEWLVEDGDPVAPGQPVVRLHPHEVNS